MTHNTLFDLQKKLAVWQKAIPIWGRDPTVWRYDAHLKVIKWDDYGNRLSPFGWEIDHYPIPVALGGTDDISNLRPLHCTTNASLGGSLAAVLTGIGSGGIGSR
jgi:hypothetical protein